MSFLSAFFQNWKIEIFTICHCVKLTVSSVPLSSSIIRSIHSARNSHTNVGSREDSSRLKFLLNSSTRLSWKINLFKIIQFPLKLEKQRIDMWTLRKYMISMFLFHNSYLFWNYGGIEHLVIKIGIAYFLCACYKIRLTYIKKKNFSIAENLLLVFFFKKWIFQPFPVPTPFPRW